MDEKRPIGLTMLFLRCLLMTGAAMIAALIVWWAAFGVLRNMGVIELASMASGRVKETVRALEEDADAPIPSYYRWARFDADGALVAGRGMDGARAEEARAALLGQLRAEHFPYNRFCEVADLPDGGSIVLQYDYSVPYTHPWAQAHLPDFQLSYLALLLLCFAGIIAGAARGMRGSCGRMRGVWRRRRRPWRIVGWMRPLPRRRMCASWARRCAPWRRLGGLWPILWRANGRWSSSAAGRSPR